MLFSQENQAPNIAIIRKISFRLHERIYSSSVAQRLLEYML